MTDNNGNERELECTCDLMAHPCEIHDTSGPPDVVRGPEWKPDLGMRVGHLKLGRWLEALRTGGCLACPNETSGNVGCLTCPGNRQDCECYEHAQDGPTDEQLSELLEMRDTQDRINAMLKTQAEIRDSLPVTYIQGVDGWTEERVEEDDDSEDEPCTHEIMHMGRCVGCSALWDGDGWELPSLGTKMEDMELTTTDKPFIKYINKTYTPSGVIDDETGVFTPTHIGQVPVVKFDTGGSKAGYHNLWEVGESLYQTGFITAEEDYRLEKDPVERLRKKQALFHKIYGTTPSDETTVFGERIDPPPSRIVPELKMVDDGLNDIQRKLVESYEEAKKNMLGEKAEKAEAESRRTAAMQAAMEEDDWGQKLKDLPDGRYYIKDPTDPSAFTRPIDVSPQGVKYLNHNTNFKTTPQGGLPKSDPVAAAQMSAYVEAFQKEAKGKSKMDDKKKVPFEQDDKKMLILGLSIMGAVVLVIVLLILWAMSGNDENTNPSPASSVTEGVDSPEVSVSEDVSDSAPVSIVDLENEWYLSALAAVGVEGMSGNEVESEGYTNDELIEMGRNACSALGETGGDFELLFTQIYVLVGEDEAAMTFAGKIVGAAVNSYCMEWIPAMQEYVEV